MSRPSGSWTSTATSSPPSWGSSASSVPSPPSATGHRSGGISPARSSPRPIAPATCGALNVPLKESGATSTGRSGTAIAASCQNVVTHDPGSRHSLTDMSAQTAPAPRIDEDDLEALQAAVGVLAAKWSVVVLARLDAGSSRFNELLRQIDGVSRRMLSATLRQLERDGLIERHVFARVPARVGLRALAGRAGAAGRARAARRLGRRAPRGAVRRARAVRPPAGVAVEPRGHAGAQPRRRPARRRSSSSAAAPSGTRPGPCRRASARASCRGGCGRCSCGRT